MADVAVVNALRAQMAGEVITAADASYDAARRCTTDSSIGDQS